MNGQAKMQEPSESVQDVKVHIGTGKEKEWGMAKKDSIRMSVHGSRTLDDERVKIIILEEIEKNGITHIVTHGEPGGVCEIARKLSKEKAIPITLHYLNFKYLRGAFEHRSKAVLKDADYAVFIHDGKSKGCSNEMILAKKLNVKSQCYQLEPSEFKTSVGFEVEKEWRWEGGEA